MTMTERLERHGWESVSAAGSVEISKGVAVTEADAFAMLMDRPYWSRAWVVQEMMSAQSLVIQCGSDVVLYSTLEKAHPRDKPACFKIRSAENPPVVKFQGDSEVTILQMGSKRMSSKRYLDCFLDRQCRLRHDNIFAFLNLLSDDVQERVKVSYEVDLRKLILDTAQAIIKSTQSLHIIGIKGRQTPPSALGEDGWQLHMPSWCPYLATPYECRPIEPHSKPNLFEERGVFSFVNSMLQVRGFVIGRVSKTILRQTPPEVRAKAWWDEADIKRERKYYWKCPSRLLLALSLPVEARNFILKHCGEIKKAIWTWQKLFSYVRFGITDRPGPYVRSHSVAQRLEHFTPAKMRQLGG
ncbi:unnamed protein product [Alternaria alternata]